LEPRWEQVNSLEINLSKKEIDSLSFIQKNKNNCKQD
jgi:hypothetical protein